MQQNQPDNILHDEGSGEDEEEAGEVDGESGGEMLDETVVGEEDQYDHEEEIDNYPAAPDSNKYGLFPVKGNNPIIFSRRCY